MSDNLPVIDVAPLFGDDASARSAAAGEIERACRALGFFYAVNHGIAPDTLARLDATSRQFFALPEARKRAIAMARGGRAWRGWFPLGGELTSGKPDLKEGLYFGEHLPVSDPRVTAEWPMHGENLYPDDPIDLRPAVDEFMTSATRASHAIVEGVALSLGLEAQYFRARYTAHPTLLFRIFHYPPSPPDDDGWGVGEHTDYGLLTLLAQDEHGGLQVRTRDGWIEAPPIAGALVCNIGDMLDRLTGGWYRSTPHRVRNVSGRQRLSFPFFFDPAFDARIVPLPAHAAHSAHADPRRWDGVDLHAFEGVYGDYLIGKVSKVFPQFKGEIARTD